MNRMSFADRSILTLYGGVLCFLGGLLFASQYGFISWDSIWIYVLRIPFAEKFGWQTLIGFLLTLIGISLFNIVSCSKKKIKKVTFATANGSISIVLAAIENHICSLINHFPEVKKVKSQVFFKRKKLRVEISLVLNAGSHVSKLTNVVQETVHQHFVDMLGLEVPLRINICVKEMTAQGNPKPKMLTSDSSSKKSTKIDKKESFEGIEY
ncbi:hypothetical protein AB834_03950 [PVC group bacterium (ex Bugula neritina AB1)]|nr:hypothetical protein AB834_03950 [PVC group bacterium (ex Bugula neritina AB1)]